MANTIKIISHKMTKILSHNEVPRIIFSDYSNRLTQEASGKKGFIKSNSYWMSPVDCFEEVNQMKIVTISQWNSVSDWNNWLHSEERKKIYESYKDVIDKESFHMINQRNPTDDIFLL